MQHVVAEVGDLGRVCDHAPGPRSAPAATGDRAKLETGTPFGLTRYVHSRACLLDEFRSPNTASTIARFGDSSQTGSVFAAFPVSNAA